jgi:hypothetical protein
MRSASAPATGRVRRRPAPAPTATDTRYCAIADTAPPSHGRYHLRRASEIAPSPAWAHAADGLARAELRRRGEPLRFLTRSSA